VPLTFARGDGSPVAVSEETTWMLLRELDTSESGGELGDRIAGWDREKPLVLSDEDHELVQQAADLAIETTPPGAVYDELMSLRMLRR
jgi:hypothetical protein